MMDTKYGKSGRGIVCIIIWLIITCSVLTGCGETAEETVQDAAVYVAQRLVTSSSGGYGLPEGFDRLIVAGDTLFFMQKDSEVEAVGRTSLAKDSGIVGIKEAELVFVITTPYIEMHDDEAVVSEKEILDMLDRSMDDGTEAVNRFESDVVYIKPNKKYFYFSLIDYAVDLNENLYLAVECSQGNYFQMETIGHILCKLTREGEWEYRTFLPNLAISQGSLAVDGTGGIYILTVEGIKMIDETGREAGVLGTEGFKGDGFDSEKIYGSPEGNVYYFIYENYGLRWRGMQVKREGGIGLQELEGFSGNELMDIYAEYKGKLFFSDTWGDGMLYVYDGETAKITDVLRWSNSNLIGSCVKAFAVLEGGRIIVWYQETGWEGLYLLTKTSVEELQEKESVILAALDNTQTASLDAAIVHFNRMNEKYQVILDDYGYSDGGADGAKVCLDAALVSANPPELLLLAGRELDKDVEKGLLEDLTLYLEGSIGLNREDLLENALKGYTVKGKLVGIPAEFTLSAVGGRASQVGGLTNWSMDDVYELTRQYPEQTKLLGTGSTRRINTREYLLGKFCSVYYLGQFVDWEKGTCDFDSEEFRKLLQWVEEYGIEQEQEPDASGHIISTKAYVTGDTLLMEGSLDFESAALWNILYDDNIILLGYPTANGKGAAHLFVKAPIGIVAGADNKEGAWEFLEYYITFVLAGNSGYGDALPTSKSHLREMLEAAVRQEYINGEPISKNKILYIENEQVPIYATSREMAEKVMAFVEEADFTPDSVLKDLIVGIILEESESYYTGDKSLKEVTELIQNRVQLILWENQ